MQFPNKDKDEAHDDGNEGASKPPFGAKGKDAPPKGEGKPPFGGKGVGKDAAPKGSEGGDADSEWSGDFDADEHSKLFGAGAGGGDEGDSEGGAEGQGSSGIRVEPHDKGGSMVHLHDDVAADLQDGADFQHHVTEHAKHYAGYLTNKDGDPTKAEAHRQAANLHSRIGNALHAGGDTMPRKGMAQAGMPPNGAQGPGQPQFGADGESVGAAAGGGDEGMGGDEGQPQNEASPGQDVTGNPFPAKPDKFRNIPGPNNSTDQNRPGKKGPPLVFLNKARRR